MKYLLFLFALLGYMQLAAQKSCSAPAYRQFDFWIGEWDVYGKTGAKAGDSKISVILDSCIILEEWTSAGSNQGLRYAGKSFSTWNRNTKQWQQTRVDNSGGSTEYLEGKYDDQKIIFQTKPFSYSKDTIAVRRLTFFNLSTDKVRQFAEITKDNGASWQTEYDLEYRRKKG